MANFYYLIMTWCLSLHWVLFVKLYHNCQVH